MSVFAGPEIVNSDLVLHMDAANKKSYDGTTNVWSDMIRSFSSNVATTIFDNTQTEISGETTVNLMYSSNNTGQFLGTISNLVGQFTIETIEANNRYRLTCTANSNFRILIPDGLLANGQTYSMSLKTNNPKMGINDFCDNAVTRVSVDFGTYYYLSATGSRATYDSTYRFFDSVSNFVIGDVIDLWDIQVEQKPYSTVFVNGVRSSNTTPVDFPGTYTFPFSSEAGGCFDFDGVEDRTTTFTGILPSSNNPISGFTGIPTASKTITVAFKTGFDVTKRQAIYSQGANARGYNIYIKNGNLYAGAYNNTSFDYGYQWPGNWATYAIQTNTWYHVTLVQRDATNILENDKLELYINGNLVSKVPGAKVGAHSFLSLGGFISTALTDDGIMFPNSYSLEGKIALVKQYNRALSAAEINQNFNALRGRFGI